MPLKTSSFFINKGYLDNIQTYNMSQRDCESIQKSLCSDVDAFFLNGLISLSASITSLRKENFSWAFIQSYYSIFYLARAFNGINNYIIIYINSKPYEIRVQPFEKFIKLKGNSHDVVFKQFKEHFPNDVLLNNTINEKPPIKWFNDTRNQINYTLTPFTDPIPPISIYNHGNHLRAWITTYLTDSEHEYTFDPKHCYIAYPIQLFNRLFDYYIDNGLKNTYIDAQKILFLKRNFSDKRGPITTFMTRLDELKV